MKLIFATNNAHKVQEIRHALDGSFELQTMNEAGFHQDIPEPHDTLRANASEKSHTIYRLTGIPCFSEDTGLEIDALNGAPGVHSARYAGEARNDQVNMQRVLGELADQPQRAARFRTVISLMLDGEERFFEGICEGRITERPAGDQGFGYDPIFIPDGSDETFAQMGLAAKGRYSHRAKAMAKLVAFLKQYPSNTRS